jgi:3-methyl-2-oxobutanoate hydroxymethyltransferase
MKGKIVMSQDKKMGQFVKRAIEMIKTEKKKISLLKLNNMKKKKELVAWVTAYDLPFAYAAEQAGIDMILVGDSGGMVQLGYKTTNPVTMNEMITLASSARRGAPNTFLIGDMPQGSYEPSPRDAVINALRFVKEAGCDAVKCEGGKRVTQQIRAMVDAGILVMGHLGLTPQSTPSFGGYRVQGKTKKSYDETFQNALELQKAGVFAILLEAIPSEPAGQIAKQLDIPVYGIGAGSEVDGQLVIIHDLMGFYQPFRPWFAKCYIPDVAQEFSDYIASLDDLKKIGREDRSDGLLVLAGMAVLKYIEEVKNKVFPGKDYSYSIKDEQLEVLKSSEMWKE